MRMSDYAFFIGGLILGSLLGVQVSTSLTSSYRRWWQEEVEKGRRSKRVRESEK